MDIFGAVGDTDLQPYLRSEIARTRKVARQNGLMLFGAIILLIGVVLLLVNNFAPDLLGLPTLVLPGPLEEIIPAQSRNSILFGAAAPLVTGAGRFVDQIAKSRRERLTLLFVRYLFLSGDADQAKRVLLVHTMRKGGGDGGGLFEFIALSRA